MSAEIGLVKKTFAGTWFRLPDYNPYCFDVHVNKKFRGWVSRPTHTLVHKTLWKVPVRKTCSCQTFAVDRPQRKVVGGSEGVTSSKTPFKSTDRKTSRRKSTLKSTLRKTCSFDGTACGRTRGGNIRQYKYTSSVRQPLKSTLGRTCYSDGTACGRARGGSIRQYKYTSSVRKPLKSTLRRTCGSDGTDMWAGPRGQHTPIQIQPPLPTRPLRFLTRLRTD